jgi:AcrR family transcriptional regulator
MPIEPGSKAKSRTARPRGRPRIDDLAQVEARLIQVGRQAFFSQGYGATTMDKIAALAGGSKGTLYSRFPSKAALFQAIVLDQVRAWETGPNAVQLGVDGSLETTLRRYGEIWLRAGLSADNIAVSRLIFSESGRFPELSDSARASSALGVEALAQVIAHFAEQDGTPCRDPQAAARFFQQLIGGWIYGAIVADAPPAAEIGLAWLDLALGVFLAGRAAW